MPFRFRKSIKILPGVKLNLSKSGISTSIGKRGASINFSKRGTRTTVGLPGTGLSYSSQSNAPKTTPQSTPPPTFQPSTNNSSNTGSGCLNGLLSLFVLPFRVVADLIKNIINPETRRSSMIMIGILSGVFVLCIGASAIIGSTNGSSSATPTNNLASLQNTAQAGVFIAFTQTAQALPINIPNTEVQAAPTIELHPSSTLDPVLNLPAPSNTPVPTRTARPTSTIYIPPVQPTSSGHPAGSSGQCVDLSYTSAQHRQGACSHHGGILTWWGP